MWYEKIEYNSIQTSAKWSCKKDEQDVDGETKDHAKWCRLGQ